jgi:hypothetical protein
VARNQGLVPRHCRAVHDVTPPAGFRRDEFAHSARDAQEHSRCIHSNSITPATGGGRLKSRSGGSASEGETSASAENLKIKLIAAEGQHDERAKLHMLWAIRLFIRRI